MHRDPETLAESLMFSWALLWTMSPGSSRAQDQVLNQVSEIQRFGFSGESYCICSISGLPLLIHHKHNLSVSCIVFSIRTTKLPSVNTATAITSLSSPRGTWLTRQVSISTIPETAKNKYMVLCCQFINLHHSFSWYRWRWGPSGTNCSARIPAGGESGN